MTKSRYPHPGCATWSQVYGEAAAGDPAYAWNVNTHNGNVNNNHRNNRGFGLAARFVGEFQGAAGVPLKVLYQAWRRARRQKTPSHNQLAFDVDWMCNLLQLQRELEAGTWEPGPTMCFVATRPKAREIHASPFRDRVAHHVVIPPLEAAYEPVFIEDSYANRKGKGTHAAVRKAQAFVRQVHSGQGGGWYLQLDIHNFFISVNRRILWAMLRERMDKVGMPDVIRRAVHALLRRPPLHAGTRVRATAAELAQVPAHKRLVNAPPGCGLPIGNLSSQFFANVYLNALDQFVKHELRAKRYLRYVDDFVLFHHDRDQLVRWKLQIERFLADHLHLSLRPEIRLRRLEDGLDFLGYVIRPTHTLARRRVVGHVRQALAEWEGQHVRGDRIRCTPAELEQLQCRVASFGGHLRHARSARLHRALHSRFPWLATALVRRRFPARRRGRALTLRIHRHE